MNTFVTQVSGDPGHDMGWTPWLVITTAADARQIGTALEAVDLEAVRDQQLGHGPERAAIAQTARDALTAADIAATVVPADHIFTE